MKKIEFKKIGFIFILIYAVAYLSCGRIAAMFGIATDSATDVALIYTVLGSFASYCLASASDKMGQNKYGKFKKEDGSE